MHKYLVSLVVLNLGLFSQETLPDFGWKWYQWKLEDLTQVRNITAYPRFQKLVSTAPVSAVHFPDNRAELSSIYSQWLSLRHPELDWQAFDTLSEAFNGDLNGDDLYLLKRKVILEPESLIENCGSFFKLKEKNMRSIQLDPSIFIRDSLIIQKALNACGKTDHPKNVFLLKKHITQKLNSMKSFWQYNQALSLSKIYNQLPEDSRDTQIISNAYNTILSLKYPQFDWSSYDDFDPILQGFTQKALLRCKSTVIASDSRAPFDLFLIKLFKKNILTLAYRCDLSLSLFKTMQSLIKSLVKTNYDFSYEHLFHLFALHSNYYAKYPDHYANTQLKRCYGSIMHKQGALSTYDENILFQDNLQQLFSDKSHEAYKKHFIKHFAYALLAVATKPAFEVHLREIRGIRFLITHQDNPNLGEYWAQNPYHVYFPAYQFSADSYRSIQKMFKHPSVAPYEKLLETYYHYFKDTPGIITQFFGFINNCLTEPELINGVIYELELAQLLKNKKHKINAFRPFYRFEDGNVQEFDLLIDDKILVETKDVLWDVLKNNYLYRQRLEQIKTEAQLAQRLGLQFIVCSKLPVPDHVKKELKDIDVQHWPIDLFKLEF